MWRALVISDALARSIGALTAAPSLSLIMTRTSWWLIISLLLVLSSPGGALAEVVVFECRFTGYSSSIFVTVYDDGSLARMGTQQGIGSRAQPHFDKMTGAWIFVELAGELPSTLTTILTNGIAWHSRHTLAIDGTLMASQSKGSCFRKAISGTGP